ncbi:MAG TPA: DUF3419 family protein [Polyangiaceae bacterium]|nr:DUF3419 family protein [Polyangiaceae bacterium]
MRIKFAVVREDPDVEHAVCLRAKVGNALVVASGGCTALTLVRRVPGLRVTAFDVAEGQLAHLETKRRAVGAGDLRALNLGDDAPAGLNQRGEFESLFRTLRRFVEELVAPPSELAAYFDAATSPEARAGLVERWLASAYWPVAFSLAFHDAFLHAMFGPAATRHAEPGSYPAYFQRAFERGLARDDGPRNPFLAHVLRGAYDPRHAPDYLRGGPLPEVALVHGELLDVPGLSRFDLVSLSNVLDWSDDALAARWAAALAEELRPGAVVVLRQLNNRRDVRRFFAEAFDFDDVGSEDRVTRDRSLFYERIEVATRRP